MRNFAPASPSPLFLSHLALTGRQSLCLILILSVSNHYSSLKAPQNLTANNHNEALKRRGERRRSWGVGEVGTGCGTGVAPAINVVASAPVSTSAWDSSALFALLFGGGCGWLPQPQSRNLSHLQFELFLLLLLFVDCLISAVVFLCLVRAR